MNLGGRFPDKKVVLLAFVECSETASIVSRLLMTIVKILGIEVDRISMEIIEDLKD